MKKIRTHYTKEALRYPRIPDVFSEPQIEDWEKITSAVHKDGTRIFWN
jgi:N-ethylmaleimide reductase